MVKYNIWAVGRFFLTNQLPGDSVIWYVYHIFTLALPIDSCELICLYYRNKAAVEISLSKHFGEMFCNKATLFCDL